MAPMAFLAPWALAPMDRMGRMAPTPSRARRKVRRREGGRTSAFGSEHSGMQGCEAFRFLGLEQGLLQAQKPEEIGNRKIRLQSGIEVERERGRGGERERKRERERERERRERQSAV
ncbi:hypothetical protein T484DRAFT_1896538 [Baffinella frigidus]|nr:hypothetical protein T484DRAFT_1896538 [Cryptophyta sp. CCMP2293]